MISGSFKPTRTIMKADAQLFRHYFAAPGALLRRAPGVDLNQLSGAPFCLAGEKIKEERPCRAVDIFAEDSIFPVKHPFGLQLFDKHISMLIYNLSTEFMQKISTLIRHLPRKTNKFSPASLVRLLELWLCNALSLSSLRFKCFGLSISSPLDIAAKDFTRASIPVSSIEWGRMS